MATDSSILVWEIPWTEEPVESQKSWTLGNRNNKKNKNNNKKKQQKRNPCFHSWEYQIRLTCVQIFCQL